MATQRLTFLYPHIFQFHAGPLRSASAHISPCRVAGQKQCRGSGRSISSTTTQKEQTVPQRYGSAQEPQPPPVPTASKTEAATNEKTLAAVIEEGVKSPKANAEDKKRPDALPMTAATKARKPSFSELKKPTDPDSDVTASREPAAAARPPQPTPLQTMEQMAETLHKRPPNAGQTANPSPQPLEKVFEMPAPTVESPTSQHQIPHLAPPPYVHHFDTYTLVKDLEKGGWTLDQSVTLMKAVRGLLGINLDVAREGLVGKSDVENETYLFRAACSELRTEILNTRKTSSTTQRTQLHHLQHSADILSQRVSQEASSLKDDLRGMLNDRRMASREQSQQRDSEISELNYLISARLIGDSKSEVEGLRWVLTRRAAIGIAGMAVLILGSLRYGSYRKHEMEVEMRRMEAEAERGRKEGGGGGGVVGIGVESERYTTPSREVGTQTGGGGEDMAVKGGEGVGYVSLG